MRRVIKLTLFCIFIFFCSTFSADADSGGSMPDPGKNPMQIVLADIARQVVMVMPADPVYQNLSLKDITGDDNNLYNALRSAIASATDYTFLDYVSLQQLLEEKQKKGGVKILKAQSGIKKRDAGWLISGKIIDKIDHPLYASMEVFLEMENMETGEIAFSRNFGASYIPSLTKYLVTALVLLLCLLLVKSLSRKGKTRSVAKAVSENDAAKLAIANELKKGRDNLKRVHDALVEAEKIKLAIKVKEQQDEVDNLLLSIEQQPAVHPESVTHTTQKDQAKQNKFMQGLVRNIQVESEKLLQAVHKGHDEASAECLADLINEIKNSRNKAYNNMAGRA